MSKRFVSFTFSLVFLLSAVFLYKAMMVVEPNSATFPTASTATISVNPPTSTAAVGQTFMIDINISDVVDLYGWEFKLRWNSTLLDALNVTEGTFLKMGGDTFFASKINNTAGYMLVDCTLLGDVPGVSGNGILATVKFYVEARGECVLDLYDTKLVSSAEQPITHTAIDGNFVAIVRDVAIISVTTSKTVIVVGEIVNITVVAKNEGTETETFNVTACYDNTSIEIQTINNLAAGANAILTFSWNTSSIYAGNYTIKGMADVVSGEKDTTDNTFIDGTVLLTTPIHDIAITNVTLSKTSVASGEIVNITVVAKNEGTETETFDVSVNYTLLVDPLIGTQTITLEPGESITLNFTWTPTTAGRYEIKAYTSEIPDDINPDDNVMNTYIYVGLGGSSGRGGGDRRFHMNLLT